MNENFAVADPGINDQDMHSIYPQNDKLSVYIYPITPFSYQSGSNNYILRVRELLSQDFHVVNKVTRWGIFDILFKLHRSDIIYLNWIEDVPDKRLGYLQTAVLFLILMICRITGKKIVWFIHNDISHSRKNVWIKKLILRMMTSFSDMVFSHSHELSIAPKLKDLVVYEHPVDKMRELKEPEVYTNDVLIWGSVSPYKGVLAFAEFNYLSDKLNDQKILVAGKFISDDFFREVSQYAKENIRFINRTQSDDELEELFRQSRYIVFCYRSPSVLSSAALCKSLSYGKTIIGPNIGSFKELGRKGLIYTYGTFDELADILSELKHAARQVDRQLIKDYIQNTSWEGFRDFLSEHFTTATKRKMALSPVPAETVLK
jgi:beta-1,4-mannosyltransferase